MFTTILLNKIICGGKQKRKLALAVCNRVFIIWSCCCTSNSGIISYKLAHNHLNRYNRDHQLWLREATDSMVPANDCVCLYSWTRTLPPVIIFYSVVIPNWNSRQEKKENKLNQTTCYYKLEELMHVGMKVVVEEQVLKVVVEEQVFDILLVVSYSFNINRLHIYLLQPINNQPWTPYPMGLWLRNYLGIELDMYC